jgi:hypothetical protein
MKRFVTTGLLVVLMSYALYAQHEYYFRFKITGEAELEQITRMISIDNLKSDTVYAYANHQQLKQFQKKTDFSLTFLEHPGAKTKGVIMADSIAEMAEWNKYPTYEVYVQMMENYAASYPDICNLESIGNTVDGRELLLLNISDNVDQQEDEPEFFYTSTIHGDETAGFVLMLRFIDSLLTNYGSDPEITNYINNIDIYVNPNANPDGTYTDDNSTVSNATRSNANLVDLNRNFPDPQDGQHPDGNSWQPETIAMMGFAEKHNFILSANFHGGEEVANYPWDTWSRRHVDDSLYRHLSYAYATPAIANSPSGYFKSLTSDGIINGYDWYSISGGRQDYMNYFQQCREITMEISTQKLLSADKLRDYWNYNKQSLFDYMEQSLFGIRGLVTDQNGNPLHAMITLEGHDSDLDSSMIFTDPDVGDYHRMVEPGAYDVIFSAMGYFSDTISNVTVYEDDSVRLNNSLEIIPTHTITPGDTAEVFVRQAESESFSFNVNNISSYNLNLNVAFKDTAFNRFADISNTTPKLAPGDSIQIDVETAPWNTQPGDYTTSIRVTSQLPYVIEMPVKIKVIDQDTLISDPEQIDTTLGRFDQAIMDLRLKNLFEQKVTCHYSFSDTAFSSVVEFDKENDTIASLSEITKRLTIKPESLSPGMHNFNINISCDSIDYTVPVHLRVLIQPLLTFNPDSVNVVLPEGKRDTVDVYINNHSETPIEYSLETADSIDWIAYQPLNGSISGKDSVLIHLFLSTSELNSSINQTTIRVNQNYSDSVYTIPVTLRLPEANSIQANRLSDELNVQCYPNPFKDRLQVKLWLSNPQKNLSITLINETGRTIYYQKAHDLGIGEHLVHLNPIPASFHSGNLFFLQVENKDGMIVKKLLHFNANK